MEHAARIDAAEEVAGAPGKNSYCKITGYIASDVRLEVQAPLDGWTQRFLMVGCGGYCGFVAVDNDLVVKQSEGMRGAERGTMATAATDLGHEKSASFFPTARGLRAIRTRSWISPTPACTKRQRFSPRR